MSIESLIGDFREIPARESAYLELVDLVTASSAEADRFAELCLAELPSGGNYLYLTLSFVSQGCFERLLSSAVGQLRQRASTAKAAAEVVEYAALQFPGILDPHLHELFDLLETVEPWNYIPWRGAGHETCRDLVQIVDSGASPDRRLRAWACLLESRTEWALRQAVDRAPSLNLGHPLADYLHHVGYDSPTSPLYRPSSRHLIFEPGFYLRPRPAWSPRSFHPTWNLSRDGTVLQFGGHSTGQCGLCAGPLHHLLTVPADLIEAPGSGSGGEVSFAACLSCLGWERPVLAYRHDESGQPRPVDVGHVEPRFPAAALREASVGVATTPSRWQWQELGASNGRENLNRLGGHPSWIQDAEFPVCPDCGRTMSFVWQLDSDIRTEAGDEWLWGSGGLCYCFWCGPCRVSAFLWQCT
jgi:hypothetical protein